MSRRLVRPLLPLALAASLLAALPACSLIHRRPRADAAPAAARPRRVKAPKVVGRGLLLELTASPDPVKLGENRQIDVTLTVRNVSRQMQTLKFPSSQLIEILLRDVATGQVVSQWSTDRTFEQELRNLTVNPGERLEYHEPITTRELKVGKPYNLEAYFVGYDKELRTTKVIIPQP